MKRLLGRPRYVVRYWNEKPGEGRVQRAEVLGGQPPRQIRFLGHPALVFTRQDTGDVHVIGRALVKDVVIEQGDEYDEWHRIGQWTLPADV